MEFVEELKIYLFLSFFCSKSVCKNNKYIGKNGGEEEGTVFLIVSLLSQTLEFHPQGEPQTLYSLSNWILATSKNLGDENFLLQA